MKQKPKWTLSSSEPLCVTIKNNAVLGFYKTIFDFFLIFSLDTIRSEAGGDLGEFAGGAPWDRFFRNSTVTNTKEISPRS